MFPQAFLTAVPKTDLHCHLDGSLRLSTVIELSRERGFPLPSETPDGLRALVFKERYRDLPEYLAGFAYTAPLLCDPEAVERVSYELAVDSLADGVRYLEVRLAPQLHVRADFGVGDLLSAVDRGMSRARREHESTERVREGKEPPFRYGIIACAMRKFTAELSGYYADLLRVLDHWPLDRVYGVASVSLARAVVEARDQLGLPVVGFDLAGEEAGHPASGHEDAFDFAHRNFLKKTVHAGEAYGPESIFQALTVLHADRIGHGTHLFSVDRVKVDVEPGRYVEQIVEYVAHHRVPIEVCITSNLQTMPELARVEDHPFGRMITEELSVTLCTDNRLVSNTTISRELSLVCEAFDLSATQVRNLVLQGFKRCFFSGTHREKRAYIRQVMQYYDRLAQQYGVPRPEYDDL